MERGWAEGAPPSHLLSPGKGTLKLKTNSLRPMGLQDSKHQAEHSQIRLGEKRAASCGGPGSGYTQCVSQCGLWAEAPRGSGRPHFQMTKQEGEQVLSETGLNMEIHPALPAWCQAGARNLTQPLVS